MNDSAIEVIKTFRSIPIVKKIAKTKEENLFQLYKLLTDDELTSIVKAVEAVERHPTVKKTVETHFFNFGSPDYPDYPYYCMKIAKQIIKAERILKGVIPSELKKVILDWVNDNTGSCCIDDYDVERLMTIDGIRGNQPETLYRGMLFKKFQMEGRGRHDVVNNIIQPLLAGKTSFRISNDNPSSWSKERDIAFKFASRRSATSQYTATMQWLKSAEKHIDGPLGIVFTSQFKPEDVVVDLSMAGITGNHGNENEVIINSGSYIINVSEIHTENGQISIKDFARWWQTYHENK